MTCLVSPEQPCASLYDLLIRQFWQSQNAKQRRIQSHAYVRHAAFWSDLTVHDCSRSNPTHYWQSCAWHEWWWRDLICNCLWSDLARNEMFQEAIQHILQGKSKCCVLLRVCYHINTHITTYLPVRSCISWFGAIFSQQPHQLSVA